MRRRTCQDDALYHIPGTFQSSDRLRHSETPTQPTTTTRSGRTVKPTDKAPHRWRLRPARPPRQRVGAARLRRACNPVPESKHTTTTRQSSSTTTGTQPSPRIQAYHDNTSEQLDYEGHATQSQNPSMPRLRGGDASCDPNRGMEKNGRSARTTQGEGYGRLPPAVANGVVDEDLFEVPSTDFYAAQGSRRNRHPQGTSLAPRAIKNREAFDFNDAQQPNPWHSAQPQQRRVPERQRVLSPEFKPNVEVEVTSGHSFYYRHQLLSYKAVNKGLFGVLLTNLYVA
ncbi:hypothetical protein HBI81_246160 [Parastagonospora nodorum]|nr:hypothetical protein HBI81_246160 [Parastagonospora nodorum]